VTILGWLRGRGPKAGLENPLMPLSSPALADWLVGPSGYAGKAITETSALSFPAVYRSVALIADTCASLPLHAYRADGVSRVVQTSGSAASLLDAPHPDLTAFEVWELGFAHALLWGNAAYWKLRDRGGVLKELWPIAPERIKFGRASDGTKVYTVDEADRPLSDREILHIPGFGYDGISGVSVIRLHREGIGLGMAAEEYGARLFGSGSLATGILTTDQRIDQKTADDLRSRWKAIGTGLASSHDVRVLGSGTTWQQLSIPPEDAQFIESRRFQIAEVARMFGVPPHMLYETDRSTSWGSGIEEQNIGFVTYTLRPWLTRFEQRISRAIGPGPVYAKFGVDALLRGNSAARSAFYRQMWELGALSTNEIRAYEELPPVDGGDLRYRPLNFGVLGEIEAPATDPAPDPVPDPAPGEDPATDVIDEGATADA